MAKQYIKNQKPNTGNECQGIELEFICVESINEKTLECSINPNTNDINEIEEKKIQLQNSDAKNPLKTNDQNTSRNPAETGKQNFSGFTTNEEITANIFHRSLVRMIPSILRKCQNDLNEGKFDTEIIDDQTFN